MNFKEKVQSMTAREIILAMVEGLENPTIKVDMYTFGRVLSGVCCGCAATNAICRIAGVTFTPETIGSVGDRAVVVNAAKEFLEAFEMAIDDLRCGHSELYNLTAEIWGFAEIHQPEGFELPGLSNSYTQADLDAYRRLAELQEN